MSSHTTLHHAHSPQEGVNNRVGFYYVVSVVAVWPVLLMTISEVWRDKGPVIRDVRDGLYSRAAYIITKVRN